MTQLTLTVASGAELSPRRFTAHEAISSPFTVAVWARTRDAALDLGAVVGKAASFTVDDGTGGTRTWKGVCSFAEQAQAEPTGVSTYYFRIVPRLWLLTQKAGHRIFQHRTIPQIVAQILREWQVGQGWRIDESLYPPLEMRVQWGESDYAFVCRMLEEAGVSYLFTEDGATVRFADAPEAAETRAGSPVPYVEESVRSREAGEHVTHLELAHEVRPGAFTWRDYDFRRPTYALDGAAPPAAGPESFYEQYHYGPGSMAVDVDLESAWTPVADNRGWVRHDEGYGAARAARSLAGERAGRRSALFQVNFVALAAGDVLTVAGHPHPELGEGQRLLVIDLEMGGEAAEVPVTAGRLAFASEPWKPRLATPRPRIRGVHAARVTTYPNEEVSPDEFGRVHVQFPWDREGQSDEDSSCWMHVASPWGGLGYGAVTLPRGGQEVLVDFLDGDPDRPVVVGRVFDATQPVPYKLPDHKTMSTWKSDSSLGSNGFNEILYEDKAGDELVSIQAERNLRKLVKNDETLTVGHDRQKRVLMQETEVTGGNRTEVTGVTRTQVTTGNRTTVVAKDRTWLVKGARTRLTEDVQMRLVEGNLDAQTGGTVRAHVEEEAHLHVVGDRRERIDGAQSVMVGGERHETVAGDALFQAGQAVHFLAGQSEVMHGQESATLKGAGGFLQIDASGVTIVGNLVRINAGGSPGSAPAASPDVPAPATEAVVVAPPAIAEVPRPQMLDPSFTVAFFRAPAAEPPPLHRELTAAEQAKKDRYQCRKGQIAAGRASGDPAVRAAADRFAQNNVAAEKAALSGAAYLDKDGKPKPAPTGWRDISNDKTALAKYGITPGALNGSRPGATHFYVPDEDVFGPGEMKPTVAFRGTASGTDWKNNFQQGTGFESAYYRDAVKVGNTLGPGVDYTGHSLGGGLASAASQASGGDGWTFNAAGLNARTLPKYSDVARPSNIQAYRVDGEVLTGLQEPGWRTAIALGLLSLVSPTAVLVKLGIGLLTPAAVGEKHDMPATSWDPVSRHLMPDVLAGVEKLKKEDQDLIAAKTGKTCP
jgi:type VI secretion system secreted protein VgrG